MNAPAKSQYRLEVNVSIREVDANGYSNGMNNRLEVRDAQDLGPMDFLEIAGVLGRFHDLKAQIAAAAEPEPEPARNTFAVTLPLPPEMLPGWLPEGSVDFDKLRSTAEKRRRQYTEALAAACGCNDAAAHSESVKP